jgi:hypothetical protein
MSEPKSYIEKVEADLAIKEEKAYEKGKGAEKAKYIFVGILLGLWLVGLLVLTGYRYIPNMQYAEAVKALENGDFRDAAIAFEKLEGHGSSEYYLETIYSQLPQYKLINAEVGDLVTFGMYNQESNVAPIELYVIAKEGNKVMLTTKHIIDAQPYSGSVTLPEWLEKTFRKDAFADNESIAISEIFVLSRQQVDTYIEGKDFAACEPTSFARSRGLRTNYADNYMWWISEASGSRHFVANQHGYVGRDVAEDDDVNGVRPGMWVSIE